jgi:hypothetical protein
VPDQERHKAAHLIGVTMDLVYWLTWALYSLVLSGGVWVTAQKGKWLEASLGALFLGLLWCLRPRKGLRHG